VAPFGHPDSAAKLVGKGITVMFSPLPRNKRARNPRQDEIDAEQAASARSQNSVPVAKDVSKTEARSVETKAGAALPSKQPSEAFANNAFAQLEVDVRSNPTSEP
jgi:hypothetical protein